MRMYFLDLYMVISFVVFARITESYKMYVLDKHGQLIPLNGVLHLDIGDTTNAMRERLTKQINDFLRKPKQRQESHFTNAYNKAKSQKRTKSDVIDFRGLINQSPVVYSNGRYTLDLDKIDVKEVKDVTNKPESKDKEYFDPAESFRDYYDYIGINDRLRSLANSKISWSQIKNLSQYLRDKDSLRKRNEILTGDKKLSRSRDFDSSYEGNTITKKKKHNSSKRFKIIGNDVGNQKKYKYSHEENSWEKPNKAKKKPIKHDSDYSFSCEEDDDRPGCSPSKYISNSDNDPKKNKKNKKKDKSPEDNTYYLQGNVMVKFNADGGDSSGDDDSDDEDSDGARRRLPQFLPKRYHWNQKDIHKLGYFWFNGPKGKYPSAQGAD